MKAFSSGVIYSTDADALTGKAATIVVNIITAVRADDNIFLIFTFFTSCTYIMRSPISETREITKPTILTTRLENRIATNMITAAATIVPRMVMKFLSIE